MPNGGNVAGSSSLEAQGRAIVERLGGVWLQRGGMCRCPAHDDRNPSLSVRVGERRLLFHCFAGCAAPSIIRALGAQRLLAPERSNVAGATDSPADLGRSNRNAAARLWAAAREIHGTPAQAYLLSRGLDLAVADLRFHARTPCGRGRLVEFHPAMLAAVRDERGLVAVYRTFLDAASPRLAALPHPKRALGRLGAGAVRLLPPQGGLLGWAEGIETAMSATLLTGIPCWALLGTSRFARVALPAGLDRLVLFLDHDSAGRRAEALVRQAGHCGGVTLDVRYPPRPDSDWNDVLMEQRPSVDDLGGEGAGGG